MDTEQTASMPMARNRTSQRNKARDVGRAATRLVLTRLPKWCAVELEH